MKQDNHAATPSRRSDGEWPKYWALSDEVKQRQDELDRLQRKRDWLGKQLALADRAAIAKAKGD